MSNWTTDDIPDQAGRVVVITGANTGLGYEVAAALAAKGAHVVLAVRNVDAGNDAARRITQAAPGARATVQRLDLASLQSIRRAADELRSRHDRIDLLINNAGVMHPSKSFTSDGFELHFGINHLGHSAFTGLLLDRLLTVPCSRVVTVSSGAQNVGEIHFDNLNWEYGPYRQMDAYAQSKLANLLFTYELDRRLSDAQTIAVAAHPGGVKTELTRNMPRSPMNVLFRLISQKPAMGALPILRAATDPSASGGQYFGPGGNGEWRGYPKVVQSSVRSHDVEVQKRLWTISEQLTGAVFPLNDHA